MDISRTPAALPFRRALPTIGIAVALAATGLAGCEKAAPKAGPTPGNTATSQTSPTSGPTTGSGGGSGDWCALAQQIGNTSGLMVGNHFISPQKETLAQLESGVDQSLAARDQLLTGLPPAVRSAMELQLQYFQALKDSNYSATPPPGMDAATATLQTYDTDQCGFVFDK